MKFLTLTISCSLIFFVCSFGQQSYRQTLDTALEKYRTMIESNTNYSFFPRTQNQNNALIYVGESDWTSGFFPGTLWYMYEYSGDTLFRYKAEKYTLSLENQKHNTSTHDLGFMMYLPYGNGYRSTGNSDYPGIMEQSARSLISRYNPTTGLIRSWDFGNWEFPVIIDNMMNLELLFWTFKYTLDSTWYYMAISHADITMKNHYRQDYSSWHLVDYSKQTGDPVHKQTFQGYNDESSWARGQAWGLYGFVMCYRETGLNRYLEHARNIAQYFIDNLPDDYVPWWDFDLTGLAGEPRDASAAAIAASALIELAAHTSNNYYLDIAKSIIANLSSDEYFDKSINARGNLLLKHCTGHKPHNSEIDVPLIYADYYFVEALSRLIKLESVTSIDIQPVTTVFMIVPNPAITCINITSGHLLQKISVYDITGKQVISDYNPNIRVDHLSPGVYFVIGQTESQDIGFKGKFIKQ